jgi:hypothetical protein
MSSLDSEQIGFIVPERRLGAIRRMIVFHRIFPNGECHARTLLCQAFNQGRRQGGGFLPQGQDPKLLSSLVIQLIYGILLVILD